MRMRKRVVGSVVAALAALAGFGIVQFMAGPADAIRVTPKPDIQCIGKVANPNQLTAGSTQEVVYTVTIKNGGGANAANVTITDTMPGNNASDGAGDANAVYNDGDSSTECDGTSQTVSCLLGTVAAGVTKSVNIAVDIGNPLSTQTFTNFAGVSTTTIESNTANDNIPNGEVPACQVAITPQPPQDLTADMQCVDKNVDLEEIPAGADATLVYTVSVKNLSTQNDATDVQIKDTLPTGVLYDDTATENANAADVDCAETGGVVTCDLPDLGPLETRTVTIVVDVPSGVAVANATLPNSAQVVASNDNSPANNDGPACTASTVVAARGDEACSPGFWKTHATVPPWPAAYPPDADFDLTFGTNFFTPDRTLLVAVGTGGGGLNAVGRACVNALLNAATLNYPFTVDEVITQCQNQAIVSVSDNCPLQ